MNETQMPINTLNPIVPPKFNLLDFIKKQKPITKIIVVVVLIIIIGTGVALGSRIWDPLWNPFRPSPEKVIRKMIGQMDEIEGFSMRIEMKMESRDITNVLRDSMSSIFDMKIDIGDSDNFKSKGTFDITFSTGGLSISFGGEYVTKDGLSFLKFNKVPILPGMDLSILTSQWIQSQEEKEESTSRKTSPLLLEGGLLSVKEELKDEKINGKKAYHYVTVIKEELIKELLERALSESLPPIVLGTVIVPSDEQIKELIEKIKAIKIEIWVGKKDNLLYKVAVSQDGTNSMGTKTIIDIKVEFSDFNELIEVDLPKEYKTLEEVFQTMFLGGVGVNTSSFDMRRGSVFQDNLDDLINRARSMVK